MPLVSLKRIGVTRYGLALAVRYWEVRIVLPIRLNSKRLCPLEPRSISPYPDAVLKWVVLASIRGGLRPGNDSQVFRNVGGAKILVEGLYSLLAAISVVRYLALGYLSGHGYRHRG